MSTNVIEVNDNLDLRLRKANDCIAAARRVKPQVRLFDEYWREGELALLFGAEGTGKSVLSMQVADAIARGTPIPGFDMPCGRRKVLYVDLRLSDAQFFTRYGSHKFAENLFRERPPTGADPFEWIKAVVTQNNIRVVVVDDISAIKRTCDGVRESLMLMRDLKQLCRDLGVSVLVISGALAPTCGLESEDDLKRSRILCTVADSVFSLGRKRMSNGAVRLIQMRTGGAEIVWKPMNAPYGHVKQLSSGMLGLEFDKRFSETLDEALTEMVVRIDSLREQGETFRSIANHVGISKTRAHALHKKWAPRLSRECKMQNSKYKMEETPKSSPRYEGGVAAASADGVVLSSPDLESENHPPATAVPLLRKEGSLNSDSPRELGGVAAFRGRGGGSSLPETPIKTSIYDLEPDLDSYGRLIYVESREQPSGKPKLWYQMDSKGHKRRFERKPFCIDTKRLNPGPIIGI